MFEKKIKKFDFKKWVVDSKVQLVFLIIPTIAVYLGTLGHDFVSDDVTGIENNPLIGRWEIVSSSFPYFLNPLFRFITVNIFGVLPAPLRAMNILFHLGIVLVVFLLISLLHKPTVAFISALLMGVHPILVESVTWISGSTYTIYTFFVLLAFLFFVLSYKDNKFYYYSVISFTLGIITSRNAMVYPIILAAFLLVWPDLDIKKEWKKIILPGVIGSGVLFLSILQIGQRLTNIQTFHYTQTPTLNPLTQIPTATTKYLELIIWPQALTLYQTEITALTRPWFTWFAFIFITFMFIGLYAYFKNKKLFFWFAFFFIALGPTLTPFGISWLVAERYARLAVLGIFVPAGWLVYKLNDIEELKNAPAIIFMYIIIPLLAIRTFTYNRVWESHDTLWISVAKTSPSSANNQNNLGDIYARRGDIDRAIYHFKKAIELLPGYSDAYHNLANVYWETGQMDLAIENYEKALEFNPNIWQTWKVLGIIYAEEGELEKSLQYMEQAAVLNPSDPDTYIRLSILYSDIGDSQKALEAAAMADKLSH